MKFSKKFYFLGLLLLVSVMLVACGDSTATSNPAPAAAPTTAAMTTGAAMMTPGTTMAPMTTSAAMMTTGAATTGAAMTPATTMAAMTTGAAMTTSAATTSGASTSAAASSGKVMEISIGDFKFAPDTLTIPVGTKVIWTNKDSTGHTVTSDVAGGPLKSDLIQQGKTFEYTFDKAGTYEYHCEPHPFMKAKIVVTA